MPAGDYDKRRGPRIFQSAIESRPAARSYFTARFFYVQEQLHGHDERDAKAKDRRAQAGLKFDALVGRGGDISKWERRAKEHDSRQPFIRDELFAALEAQVCRSYRQLSRYVNGWCQPQTIERWLNSHPAYEVYRKI